MTSRGAHTQSEKPLVEGHYITKCTFHFPLLRICAAQFFIQTQLGYLLSCYCILELIMKNITSPLEIITEEYNNSWCFSDLQGHNVKLFWTCSGLENVNHTFIFLSTFQVLLLFWPMPGKLSSYIKLLNYWSCKHGKHVGLETNSIDTYWLAQDGPALGHQKSFHLSDDLKQGPSRMLRFTLSRHGALPHSESYCTSQPSLHNQLRYIGKKGKCKLAATST